VLADQRERLPLRWSAAADKGREPRQELITANHRHPRPGPSRSVGMGMGTGCQVFTERTIGEMHKMMIDQHQHQHEHEHEHEHVEGSCLAVACLSKHSIGFSSACLGRESLDAS
jgi:hypothetical protein